MRLIVVLLAAGLLIWPSVALAQPAPGHAREVHGRDGAVVVEVPTDDAVGAWIGDGLRLKGERAAHE